MARLKSVRHDEEVSVVEHLDELRSRIIVCAAVLLVACGLAFWQNHLLLAFANAPLPGEREPLTLGVTEPFFTTLRLSIYGGLLLALPVLLYQAYAFILPALKATERRAILPFLVMVPILFIAGVAFSYLVVVPAATEFLLGFNDDEFNIEVRASDYYGFFVVSLIAVGFMFQIPAGVLSLTRLGITTPEQLAANRRYALLVIAIASMLLPGTDPVTMLISMAPLYGLFEFSIVLARAMGRPPQPVLSTGS